MTGAHIGTFNTPRCSGTVDWPTYSWAVFYLDGHPHVAAIHRSGSQWQCTFLKYDPDARTFRDIGMTTFAGWARNEWGRAPYIVPLHLKGAPYCLVGSFDDKAGSGPSARTYPGRKTHAYRVSDVYEVDDAGNASIRGSWEDDRDVGDVGRRGFNLPGVLRFATLNTFQLEGESYVFGLRASGRRNRASIWRVNEETWSFEVVGSGPFPSDTVLVLSFQADNHTYLFSLDEERNTGNIWRIRDGLDGWDRVYWADHRVRYSRSQAGVDLSVYAGYFRQLCTTFELDGRPYMFMKWTERNWPVADTDTGHIVGLERRNWIRLVNAGATMPSSLFSTRRAGKLRHGNQGHSPSVTIRLCICLPTPARCC